MDGRLYKIVGIAAFVIVILLVLIIVLSLYLFNGSTSRAEGPKLVIDHDGGADDAMAIFMALLYETYFQGPQVIGLTTSHGNVNETQVYENSQRFLGLAKRRDVPIYRGCNSSLVETYPSNFYFGYDGLGDGDEVLYDAIDAQPKHAALALIQLSKEYAGELSIVALGALTNIAVAIKLDPDFISRLEHLYVGAGNVYSANHTEAEFNALIDVEAYHVVAENSTPDKVTFIPFSQILSSHNISREWRENILGAIPTEIMQNQNFFERLSIVQATYWTVLDPVVMAIVLDETVVEETKYSINDIILCGDQRGINSNEFTDYEQSNVKIVYSALEEPYKRLLIDIFSAELK